MASRVRLLAGKQGRHQLLLEWRRLVFLYQRNQRGAGPEGDGSAVNDNADGLGVGALPLRLRFTSGALVASTSGQISDGLPLKRLLTAIVVALAAFMARPASAEDAYQVGVTGASSRPR